MTALLLGLALAAAPPQAKAEWPQSRHEIVYWSCACADLASTAAALNTGRFREGNPLARAGSTDATLVRLGLLKGLVYGGLKLFHAPKRAYSLIGGVQCGVAGLNTWKVVR